MNITGVAMLKALLLHLAGDRVHDIYDTLATDTDKYVDVKEKLKMYFTPKKSLVSGEYVQKNSATARWKLTTPDFAW